MSYRFALFAEAFESRLLILCSRRRGGFGLAWNSGDLPPSLSFSRSVDPHTPQSGLPNYPQGAENMMSRRDCDIRNWTKSEVPMASCISQGHSALAGLETTCGAVVPTLEVGGSSIETSDCQMRTRFHRPVRKMVPIQRTRLGPGYHLTQVCARLVLTR